jgi:hypothetical protein
LSLWGRHWLHQHSKFSCDWCGARDRGARRQGFDQTGCCLRLAPADAFLQELQSAAAREVARKERERLKQQDKLRREHLEHLRTQQNSDAAKGEVRAGARASLRRLRSGLVAFCGLGKQGMQLHCQHHV